MPRTKRQSADRRRVLEGNRLRQIRVVEVVEQNNLRNIQSRQIQRTLPSQSRLYNSSWRANRRQDAQFRQNEQLRNTAAHSQRREDSEYREAEQMRNTVAHTQRRQDPEYRELYRTEEQLRNTAEHQSRRNNPSYRAEEQLRNTSQRSTRRAVERRELYNVQRNRNLRVMLHRCDNVNRNMESVRQSQRNRINMEEMTSDELQENRQRMRMHRNSLRFTRYNDTIKHGPTVTCICCGGLWFSHQIEQLSRDRLTNVSTDFINDVFCLSESFPSENNKYNFCKTCSRSIKNRSKPKIRLSNGLEYPQIPECLKGLTPIEERLITPRLPFMIIVALGFERQSAIRGAVVNVPISVNETVTALPRTFNQSHVIQLHLRRRLEYQHDYMTETIRPAKVIEAIQHLISKELYIKHGIQIDDSWLQSFPSQEVVPFVGDQTDENIINDIFNNQDNENNSANNAIAVDEMNLENLNPGGQETLL